MQGILAAEPGHPFSLAYVDNHPTIQSTHSIFATLCESLYAKRSLTRCRCGMEDMNDASHSSDCRDFEA